MSPLKFLLNIITKKNFRLTLLIFSILSVFSADIISGSPFPYFNPELPVEERIKDLLGRMTLEEKIGQMDQYLGPAYAESIGWNPEDEKLKQLIIEGAVGSFIFVSTVQEANELQRIAEQSRLQIPLINCIDAVHGLCPIQGATIFPSPIGVACSFDTDIAETISGITAREMRAMGIHWALHPMLGIAREPRWGRTAELFGEDPYLTSQMARATIRGFQGEDFSSPHNVIACIKTFVTHSVPLGGRGLAVTDVSERTLRAVFLPPYKAAVEEGVFSLMPAYHDFNGVPCHASKRLLTDILRKEWGFKGFIVSDWGGVEMLHGFHHVASTDKEAVKQAIYAGVDIHMHGGGFGETLFDLVKEGAVSERRIDESVERILEAKFRLGLFENRYVNPDSVRKILFSEAHKQAALQAARESLVLLENKNSLLPLRKDIGSILVTGPNADNFALMGDWTAPQPKENYITVLEGIKRKISSETKVRYVDVGRNWQITDEKISLAASVADNSDLAIVVVGGNHTRYDELGKFDRKRKERTGGEGTDRADLELAGRQLELVQEVFKTGTPTVVVLINGRPLSINWIAGNIPAVIEAWEPGSEGGLAIAEVLFGDYNPSGKLSISFPVDVGQLPVYYNHSPSAERNYHDIGWEPLYPFGHGLSFTTFEYSRLIVPEKIQRGREVEISVTVRNSGNVKGDECVLLFINDLVSSVTTPVRELKGFKRVCLEPGEKKTISFVLPPTELSLFNRNMERVVESGNFKVMLGGLEGEFAVE